METSLTSWYDDGDQHIVFLTPHQHVYDLYSPLGATGPSWQGQDLKAITPRAPAAVAGSALKSWIYSTGQHVVYVSSGGHVNELFCAMGTGPWVRTDLTTTAGAPLADLGSALVTWVDSTYQYVVYLTSDGSVHELYYALATGPWTDFDVSAMVGPNAAAGSALTGWADQNIIFLTLDGHVHYLNFDLKINQWATSDLTYSTDAPTAVVGSALTSWVGGAEGPHVVYLTQDGQVIELNLGVGLFGLASKDLTSVAGAPAAAPGSALTSWLTSQKQHVVYLTPDGHVHELYQSTSSLGNGGPWMHQEIVSHAGTPTAAAGSALTSWAGTKTQHVIYIAAHGHVHELSSALDSTGAWTNVDVTAQAKAPGA